MTRFFKMPVGGGNSPGHKKEMKDNLLPKMGLTNIIGWRNQQLSAAQK